jgi:hypothetical protein
MYCILTTKKSKQCIRTLELFTFKISKLTVWCRITVKQTLDLDTYYERYKGDYKDQRRQI